MSRITLDRDTLAKLMAENGPVEVCDPSGLVVGRFAPNGGYGKEPRISEEELARREAAGGGRTLAEIMGDLQKRALASLRAAVHGPHVNSPAGQA